MITFPAVRDFPHLQGVLSKLPELLAKLTVWQEHGKALHLDQVSFHGEVAAPAQGVSHSPHGSPQDPLF